MKLVNTEGRQDVHCTRNMISHTYTQSDVIMYTVQQTWSPILYMQSDVKLHCTTNMKSCTVHTEWLQDVYCTMVECTLQCTTNTKLGIIHIIAEIRAFWKMVPKICIYLNSQIKYKSCANWYDILTFYKIILQEFMSKRVLPIDEVPDH